VLAKETSVISNPAFAVDSGNSKWSPRFRKLFIFKKIKKIILELLK
jgi:hypothetical protein